MPNDIDTNVSADQRLARTRLATDVRLKRAELAFKRAELLAKSKARLITSPLVLAIVGGTLSIIGRMTADLYRK